MEEPEPAPVAQEEPSTTPAPPNEELAIGVTQEPTPGLTPKQMHPPAPTPTMTTTTSEPPPPPEPCPTTTT